MIRRPPRSTPLYSSAASDVYKRQLHTEAAWTGSKDEAHCSHPRLHTGVDILGSGQPTDLHNRSRPRHHRPSPLRYRTVSPGFSLVTNLSPTRTPSTPEASKCLTSPRVRTPLSLTTSLSSGRAFLSLRVVFKST